MKLHLNSSTLKTYDTYIHPSGYRFNDDTKSIENIKKENPIKKTVSLQQLHLDITVLREKILIPKVIIDPHFEIYKDLVNEYGLLTIETGLLNSFIKVTRATCPKKVIGNIENGEGFNVDEAPSDLVDIINSAKAIYEEFSVGKEGVECWMTVIEDIPQYLNQGLSMNKVVKSVINFKINQALAGIYPELSLDGKFKLVPHTLLSAYAGYSFQQGIGELNYCKYCGERFINEKQGREKKFCSDKCRTYFNLRKNKS